MSGAARGFIMIAIAFPIYLVWRGRLPTYLQLMVATATTANQATVPNFSTTPSAGSGLGANVLGAPGSGSGAAGSPIPIPGL